MSPRTPPGWLGAEPDANSLPPALEWGASPMCPVHAGQARPTPSYTSAMSQRAPGEGAEPPDTSDSRILASRDGDIDRHVRLIADEFRMGFEAVASIDRPAVTIFGSARVPADDADYEAAMATGRLFAKEGF